MQEKYYDQCVDITDISPISGVLMLLNKGLWKKACGFEEKGILGIDNSIHYRVQALGQRVMVMKGVYVYHWYRGGNPSDKRHLT